MKYLAYYENYLKSLAQELKLPIYDANGDNFINIKDYENILSVYFHGKIRLGTNNTMEERRR